MDTQYRDLHGLPLLPLQNGSWVIFNLRGSGSPVYLCTQSEAKAFLGLEGQIASTKVAQPVCKVLREVANSGQTQLCQFQPQQHGPNLLLQSAKHVQQCQPSDQQVGQWLCEVWGLLQHLTLHSVEHIPLLPTSKPPSAAYLTPLSSPVVVDGRGGQLSGPQMEALTLLGVVVVPSLPSHFRHIELQSYLYSADRHGTAQALSKVVSRGQQMQAVTRFNTQKTELQRQAITSLIETSSIQVSLRGFLAKLNIFKAQDINNLKHDSCLESVNTIAPELKGFPVSYPQKLLTPTQPQERALALALGAQQLSKENLCIRALQSCNSDENVLSLVRYILGNPHLVGSSSVLQQLRNTRFVPNVAGSLCRPSELYDAEDEDRCVLIGEIRKPDDSFSKHCPLLRSLGLRKVQDMPRDEFICLIKNLKNSQLSMNDKTRKSVGLLQAMNRRADCLQVCQAVLGVPFVFGASTRPCGYPSSLQWATSPGPLVPQELRSIQYSSVLGSTTALVECHHYPSVASAFGWLEMPTVESVIQHLKNLAAAYQVAESDKYFDLIKQTYRQLSTALNGGQAPQLANLRKEDCVFTDLGFRAPDEVYIRPDNGDLQLLPYLHLLPFGLRESESLFLHLGCAGQQNPSLLLTVLGKVGARHQDGRGVISRKEVEQDRRLVMTVLDRLQHHLKELPGPLLVPVKTKTDVLELAEVGCTAYTEGLTTWLDSDELGVKVVHECVSASLAHALGVAPLQNFLSIGGEAVMEWGQREPLTTRLRNLLQQYRDGMSILKELVQNADDAGATTVHLLYDERQNEDAKTLLLSPEMKQCQGPALWVYNDAHFSETDFENLREVGAGTKEFQPTKIGKFGLGFCSVYNLTDVPSFISGSSYVVFDPHMTHLSHAANSPGLRFNFKDRRNSYMLRTLVDQFQPFSGVFGCNVQESGSFEGTLFRLPFRTSASKISDTCYSRGDMVQLLKMFSGMVGQLLLFTQHVSSIHVSHLSASASTPSEMVELIHASRTPGPFPDGPQSVLERAAALFSKQNNNFKWKGKCLAEKSTAEISVRYSRGSVDLCGLEEGKWNTTWVTSWHSGTGSASRLAETLGGKALPLAAVAVPVRQGQDGWQPLSLMDIPTGFYREGHFHCFLPLPVRTLLPVQINGVVEVASDRTNLLAKTEDDRHTLSWNTTLAGDSMVRAYLGLAEELKNLGLCAESPYHAMWPVVHPGIDLLVEGLASGFYRALEQEDLKLFRCSDGEWHPLARCRFLKQDFLQVPHVGDIAFEFLQTYFHSTSELRLVRLPQHILACLSQQVLSQQVVTKELFFREYFIPHMSEGLVSPDKRDQLTLHLLDVEHPILELLRPLACIPTLPHGTLRLPVHLIKPGARIARMFCVDDERFPAEEFISSSKRSSALARLGMNTNRLPKELVVERAETVAGLLCSQCACDRLREILHYISKLRETEQDEFKHNLESVPFLPVMPKPKDWSIAWHGECQAGKKTKCCPQHVGTAPESLVFDCPLALCLPKLKPLVGSCCLILDQSLEEVPERVLQRFGVITCALDLPLQSVLEQLSVLSAAPPEKENVRMCHAVYDHLEEIISRAGRGRAVNSAELDKIEKLKEKKILITKYGFQEPKLFALYSEVDCAPDLFSASTESLEKYPCLMGMLGIKKNFDYDAVIGVIQKKRETFSNSPLSTEEVSQISNLLSVLYKVKEPDQSLTQDLYLPDSKGRLHPTKNLCFDDGAELSSGQFLCLHKSISVSPDMLEWLKIKSKTRKRLQQSSNRLHFGQNEPLTTRLRNILEDYPCDSGIMKELLQNADDAGATEVAFIKDFRNLPCQKLFDSKCTAIQGPALSVFNDRGFTEKDLQSIQDLGNSSKKEDPATTGQYGIGFNAVYHLTDAPSFLTRGPQVPHGETLCMFDPHCWYDPAATPQYPGVQYVNLNDLRLDHSDSFIGYLESELSEEGTMFRLPLRTTRDSLIAPHKVTTVEDVEKMLKEFQRKMPQCLLFLRNVRKISIKEVQIGGLCKEVYCVGANVSQESLLPALIRKYGDTEGARDPCSVDMVRTSYTMSIEDSQGSSSQWMVVQQQGVEEKNSLPPIVLNAFRNKTLNLLPHGGVALLLNRHDTKFEACNYHSTSCYLPLPVRSGLPFSVNGHFALDQSRHNLWIGYDDAKSLWNEWLMKELLVPVAVHAVKQLRSERFPREDEGYMTEQIYHSKVRVFHSFLPVAYSANPKEWIKFIKWFYEKVRDIEFPLFDSFIPENDLKPPSSQPRYHGAEPARENRKGQLRWHAFHASGENLPVFFSTISEQDKDHKVVVPDVLRRLGMKLSSEGMLLRLRAADPQFECPLLSPETALAFLTSWDKDVQDRCLPRVGNSVADTPFLTSRNVLSVLKYVTKAKDFPSTSVDKLPLLLTNDGVLGHFSVGNPVFSSTFCDLLPAFKREFLFCAHVSAVENISSFSSVVKEFTPADFVERLTRDPDTSGHVARAKLPLANKDWLMRVWSFIIDFIEKMHPKHKNWKQSKEYILQYLGDWALYPIKEGNQKFCIPIKDAWQVLNMSGHSIKDSVFSKLPVPFPFCIRFKQMDSSLWERQERPYIPHELEFDASLKDPVAALKLLFFHRESINNFLRGCSQGGSTQIQSQEILDYLGSHCQGSSLSRHEIRSLQMFSDMTGQLFDLLGRSLIVLANSSLSLNELKGLCDELSLLLTLKPTSDNITKLYSYIEPNCIIEEIDLYAKIILPNMSSLTEETRKFYLGYLKYNLPKIGRENKWSKSQQKVVKALKVCSFIEVDGTLRTADSFYDPLNPVFDVMGVSNLPEAWREWEWRDLLQLAGMIHKVTPEMFLEFASLSPRDECVKKKSEVLCEYLDNHLEEFQSVKSQILDKEFLVPEKNEMLERLLAHHQTESGLVAFSDSVDPKLAHVIWSTRSLLPNYAVKVARNLQKQHNKDMTIDPPPVEDILEHIIKLCSSLKKEPEKLPVTVKQVMESIYDYLSKNIDGAFQTLKDQDIPLVHIPDHKVFVPISIVVASLEEEILPYLYKAPTFYGKFFDTLKRLGMQEKASSNTYAQVLRMIHDDSGQRRLHPQEAKTMMMAMKGLVKHPFKLKDLSISELYLPAKDGTLRNSVQMFVADNIQLFFSIRETFQEPVFIGFTALKIYFEESSLVNLLPQRLRPKYLSEACQESLMHEDMEDVASQFLNEVHELLQAEELKIGVLRIIDHYKLKESKGLTHEERKEIVTLLGRVRVRHVTKITTILTLHNKTVGKQNKEFFYQVDGEGDQQILTVFLCKKFSERLLNIYFHKAFSLLLHKWNVDRMNEFQVLFGCVGKPHFIHHSLNLSDIKAYSAQPSNDHLFMCDVGTYLEESFLPYLDNEFYSFFIGEVVCLRKYLCRDERENEEEEEEEEEEGDIFLIVQVVRLVERHATCLMMDTYEVNTSLEQPCLVTVKAYQLFRFVRKERKDFSLILASATEDEDSNIQTSATKDEASNTQTSATENEASNTQTSATEDENLSEEQLFRKVRKQVKEIWGVDDEQERRRLLRRLLFKWHPDKNLDRVDLCTRLVQYIQSLVGRLERGDHIPDEEDETQAPRTNPSEAYSRSFRRPGRRYRSHNTGREWRPRSHNRGGEGMPRNNWHQGAPRSDFPEAQRWYRQARHDLGEAEAMARRANSWAVFMCYQAAEKILLATLYSQDMEEACQQNNTGPLSRTLSTLANLLNNPRARHLADSIQHIVGDFLKPLYPNYASCPHECYSDADAHQLLEKTRELFNVLEEHFV
ncbi:sacsin-like isoform X1 [Eriocheir sinensis]|uniref:sacsin-like isoform X1 n=1 Tax=Eriocheir sinensis TaxID=95602 RepID=UPI0021C70FDF|nr:sacsin-like isoform X1 [Eriocheir sinensis]